MKLKGFQKLTLTDKALKTWFNALSLCKPAVVNMPIQDALYRILAENLIAPEDLPRFDKSAMDGYAIRSVDVVGASQFKPIILQLSQEEVGKNQAKQIWTGNPIPKGADSVIILENTAKKNGQIAVWAQLSPGSNISQQGEDIKKSEVVVKAGIRLNPYHIGLAAALGFKKLKVTKKPKIAIIPTGNELVDIGAKRLDNQIYDSNLSMVSAMCRELGAQTTDFGIAKDNTEEISQRIKEGIETNDAVITTGGTSVGGLDLVPEVINKLGKPGVVVHGIALRPAMPTALGVIDGKPVLILSGNPVAAVIGFEVFGRPLLCRMLGMPRTELRPTVEATLSKRVTSALGRKTYIRVRVTLIDGEFVAEPISSKGSGSLSTMTQSNGYLVVDENREGVAEGEKVTIQLFAALESS